MRSLARKSDIVPRYYKLSSKLLPSWLYIHVHLSHLLVVIIRWIDLNTNIGKLIEFAIPSQTLY
jgi:hypothetical protein